jgi:cellulose synthase/poly-beta-1,6-N-acetylglucosamine synthase-like glycosyltransferase
LVISLIEALMAIPAAILLLLAAFFALEIAGALLPSRRAPSATPSSVAVIIPAHNEAAVIGATLRDIKAQLRPADRLIVVADNCTDATAEIAMRAGAACLIRNDPENRGKGFALQFALDALKEGPPAVVFFVDADCLLGEGAVAKIAGAAAASERPAQGLYLMRADDDAPASRKVAEFAWLLMNQVRMAGLSTLFDVCRLTGSGWALPWAIARDIDLASEEIVEDLALSAALISKGAAPVFVPEAMVTSVFPYADDGAARQHARWEIGSLRFAARRALPMLVDAIGEADIRRAAAALDLAILPLTLFAASIGAVFLLSLLVLAGGGDLPYRLAAPAFGFLIAGVAVSWIVFGRKALPPSALGALFDYLVDKAKVYGKDGRASAESWTRTERDGDGGPAKTPE